MCQYIKNIHIFHLPCTREISPQLMIYKANKKGMLKLKGILNSKTEQSVKRLSQRILVKLYR